MNETERMIMARLRDQEDRIRSLEKWVYRMSGGLVFLSLEVPIFSGLVIAYIKWGGKP